MSKNEKTSGTGIVGKFSVGLGLFDYINPILYGITAITIITNMHGIMSTPLFWLYVVGAVSRYRIGLIPFSLHLEK